MLLRMIVGITILGGCGIKVGNPKKPGSSDDKSNEFYASLSERISGQLDESINAIALGTKLIGLEQGSTGLVAGGSLALSGAKDKGAFQGPLSAKRPPKPTKQACTTAGDSVIFVQEFDHEFSDAHPRGGRSVSISGSFAAKHTATWSNHDKLITCSGDELSVPIAKLSKYDLVMDIQAKKTKTIKNPENGTVLRSGTSETKGVRRIEWRKQTSAGGKDRVLKTLTMEITRSHNGAVSTIKTSEPLVIEVLIDQANPRWQSQTIQKGAMENTNADGQLIKSNYENVALRAGKGCEPAEGSYKGEVFAKASLVSEFDVDFKGGNPYIRFGDKHRSRVVTDTCDFE